MLVAGAAVGPAADGGSSLASLELDVTGGSWQGVRLKNVPTGTQLEMKVVSDGAVEILLLDADQYARFPAAGGALFRGRTEQRLATTLRIPRSGDYYVLIDNRAGATARSVQVEVAAELAGGARSDRVLSDHASAKLKQLGDFLASLLRFRRVPFGVESCGQARSFRDAPGVVLCRDYARALHEEFRDPRKSEDALVFALLHRFGHTALGQWGRADAGDEQTADEFALALLRLTSNDERFREQLLFLSANAVAFERIAVQFRGDAHPLSARRTRGLAEAWSDGALMERWQPILVPQLQTAALEELRRTPTSWADTALVERELAKR